ncbi:MAG: Holliday junction branch migration protein RuvA [Pseudomonadota bacterium]
MIGRLHGQIQEKGDDGQVLMDVGGVGFEVLVPRSEAAKLPLAPERTTLFIHLSVRDDAITLYGFPSRAYLLVFKLLIKVKNIGPRHAVNILSALKPEEVAAALQREDSDKFKAVSGIGKKTADMIILELRDKIRKTRLKAPSEEPLLKGKLQDVLSALLHLGFKQDEAGKAANALQAMEKDGAGVEEMIREALSGLTK